MTKFEDYKLNEKRERYRINNKDIKYLLIFYFFMFFIGVFGFIYFTSFMVRWNLFFFMLLISPFIVLEFKSKIITKKRMKDYYKTLDKESNNKKIEKVFILYPDEDSNFLTSSFKLVKPICLDFRFAIEPLHELKRFAVLNKYNAIINVKNDKGIICGVAMVEIDNLVKS